MITPIIAVDIDDVLSRSAEGFAEYSNQRWQSNITVDHYDEDWAKVWRVSREEAVQRAILFHQAGVVGDYEHFQDAAPALKVLEQSFELVIVTSRREVLMPETDIWLSRHFKGLFKAVHYSGFFDRDSHSSLVNTALTLTKADICKRIGVSYLIDDQLKHCVSAAEAGIQTVLFGNYSWNQTKALPLGVDRAHSWQDVLSYFKDRI
jgi:uncharacterized HAD superfamily protein